MSQGAMDGGVTTPHYIRSSYICRHQPYFPSLNPRDIPHASELYNALGMKETKITSMRKAIAMLKKQQPDLIVAEFFYG